MSSNLRTGGQLIVDSLRTHGVDTVYCLPGESYLHVLDAFHDAPEIRLVVCRQEGGAAYMADADAKITGKPGVLFVSRGPGACNASVGIHTAFQDSTPMVVFIGQIPRASAERFAFQEIDYRRMYSQSAKWIAQIEDAARIPEMVSRAFHVAMAGRPGPVILVIPEDMQEDRAQAETGKHYVMPRAYPAPDDMARLRGLLERAERPLRDRRRQRMEHKGARRPRRLRRSQRPARPDRVPAPGPDGQPPSQLRRQGGARP